MKLLRVLDTCGQKNQCKSSDREALGKGRGVVIERNCSWGTRKQGMSSGLPHSEVIFSMEHTLGLFRPEYIGLVLRASPSILSSLSAYWSNMNN